MGKPQTKWSFQNRKHSTFKIDKTGCRHYFAERVGNLSCMYCGFAVYLPENKPILRRINENRQISGEGVQAENNLDEV